MAYSKTPEERANAAAYAQEKEDKTYEMYADLLVQYIKNRKDDWLKPWINTQTGLPHNMSGRNYSGINSLVLMFFSASKGWNAPIFATFNQIKALNLTKDKNGDITPAKDKEGKVLPTVLVKKGEKSFPVILPIYKCINKDTKKEITMDDYAKLSEEEKENYVTKKTGTKVYLVFNIDQTDMAEKRPELYQKLTSAPEEKKIEVFEPLTDMTTHQLWRCPISHSGNQAFYRPMADSITLPKPSQFNTPEDYASTALHEMAHSTGAIHRFARPDGHGFGSPSYAREELVAEFASILTCARFNIGHMPSAYEEKGSGILENSASYLRNWLMVLGQGPNYVKNVLEDAKKASMLMSARIEGIMELKKKSVDLSKYTRDTIKDSFEMDLGVPEYMKDYYANNKLHSDTVSIDKDIKMVVSAHPSKPILIFESRDEVAYYEIPFKTNKPLAENLALATEEVKHDYAAKKSFEEDWNKINDNPFVEDDRLEQRIKVEYDKWEKTLTFTAEDDKSLTLSYEVDYKNTLNDYLEEGIEDMIDQHPELASSNGLHR